METNGMPRTSRRIWLSMLTAMALAPAVRADGISSADVATLDEARRLHETGRALLVDIRESEEHTSGVAAGSQLLPMSQLARRVAELPTDPARPVLLICRTQNRSSHTLKWLRRRGYAHVRYVHGGMSEWARRGWPMVRP